MTISVSLTAHCQAVSDLNRTKNYSEYGVGMFKIIGCEQVSCFIFFRSCELNCIGGGNICVVSVHSDCFMRGD